MKAATKLSSRRRLFLPLFLFIVIVAGLAVLARENIPDMLETILQADHGLVAAAFGISLLSIIHLAMRWRLVLSAIGRSVKLRDAYLIVYGSIFINNVTPLTYSGGDPIGRTYLLHKVKGIPYLSGFASVLGEYVLDFPVYISFVALGAALHTPSAWPIIIGPWIGAMSLYAAILPRFPRSRGVIGKLMVRVLGWGKKHISEAEVMSDVSEFFANVRALVGQWRKAARVILVSLALWSLSSVRLLFIFQALGYTPTLSLLLLGPTLPLLAGLIPLLPGGLGTVDAAYISLFLFLGVPWEIAVAATLIERAIWLIFNTIIGAGALSYIGIRVWG